MNKLLFGIDLTSFYRAFSTFEKFSKNLGSEQEKAGAIQAFEFSFELAWKTMKRLLAAQGIEARSPRDTFREAAAIGIISDPLTWFEFIDMRNLTTHTYNQEVIKKIVAYFPKYSASLNEFIKYIENEISKT